MAKTKEQKDLSLEEQSTQKKIEGLETVDSQVDDTVREIHDLVQNASKTPDYSESLNKLAQCQNPAEFFGKISEEANDVLAKEPAVYIAMEKIEESFGAKKFGDQDKLRLFDAIKTNDFSDITFSKTSREYGLALALTAIRNNIISDLAKKGMEKHAERLGITVEERKIIIDFLAMISVTDDIYIKWRTQLYPPEFLAKLKKARNPKRYLEKRGLDDPYSVVRRTGNGEYVNVPYAKAFQKDYEKLSKILDATMKDLPKGTVLDYLEAYKAALNLGESKKVDGEWESEKLWKEVAKKWLLCNDRLQVTHAMEFGYEVSADPSSTKIIPELKIAIKTTSPDIDKAINMMKAQNVGTLETVLSEDLPKKKDRIIKTFKVSADSHVNIVGIISGGGNSMDNMGTAQLCPNDETVLQENGVKASVDYKDDGRYLREKRTKNVFGEDLFNKNFQFKPESTPAYLAEFIAGHELGHIFLGKDIGDLEEIKATWTAMVAMHEREKMNLLPGGTSDMVMREHVKYCLKYLADTAQETDCYGHEGIANMKIFLKTGLISKSEDKKWEFHPDKIDDTYAEIKKKWLRMTNYWEKSQGKGRKYRKWARGLISERIRFFGTKRKISKGVRELRNLAFGKEED